MAKHPAAFINFLSETRDFKLAIESLQETWDKLQDSYEQRGRLRHNLKTLLDCANAIVGARPNDPDALEAFEMFNNARTEARPALLHEGREPR